MYTVSITRLRVRSIFYLPLFALYAFRSGAQAQRAEGLQDFATRVEAWDTHWTRTVWREEASMKHFRNSGAHQLAMRLLSEMCSEASYARWQQETPEPPTWDVAHQHMLEHGTLSKVKHPSKFHLEGRTAPIIDQVPWVAEAHNTAR